MRISFGDLTTHDRIDIPQLAISRLSLILGLSQKIKKPVCSSLRTSLLSDRGGSKPDLFPTYPNQSAGFLPPARHLSSLAPA